MGADADQWLCAAVGDLNSLDEPQASLGNAAAVLRHTLGVRSNVAGISTLQQLKALSNSCLYSTAKQ